MSRSSLSRVARAAALFVIASGLALGGLTILNLVASPSTLAFSSTNPSVTSTRQATVTFTFTASPKDKPWTLSVASSASTFSNCGYLPVSAVSVQCSNVGITGTKYLGTGACASNFNLSTTPTQVAGGLQGDGDQYYTILINYVLTDAWRYPGANSPSCSLSLDYTVFASK